MTGKLQIKDEQSIAGKATVAILEAIRNDKFWKILYKNGSIPIGKQTLTFQYQKDSLLNWYQGVSASFENQGTKM